jgi:hypothetical protein
MNLDQMKTILTASASDVDHLAELRSNMDCNDFNLLCYQQFSKYIKNSKVLKFIVESGNNTYELSRLLEMEGSRWFGHAIKHFCMSFENAMENNRNEVIGIINKNYPSIHESLKNYHDSFFLQHQNTIVQSRHQVRAYFRMMGDTIESVYYPHIQCIYQIMTLDPSSKLYGRPLKVSNGKAVSELLQISEFYEPLSKNLENISLSQWRNISQHSSYSYDIKSEKIICQYGNDSTVTISLEDLVSLLQRMNVLQSLLKMSIEFPILDHMDQFEIGSELEITVETLLSQLGNAFSLNGYELLDIQRNHEKLKINIKDTRNRGVKGFKADFEMFKAPITILMHNGISTTIELFNSFGKSIQKVHIERRSHG